MQRSRLIRVSLAALLGIPALWLLAMGPRSDEDVPRGRVVVDYWEKWGGAEGQAMQDIVDWFNNTVGRDKRIYVRYLSMSNIQQKTLVSIAAGVPPDIAGLFDAQLVQYAAQAALRPLDDLAAEAGFTADIYKKVYWDICNFQGHLWALGSTPAAVALHYNKRIFCEEADALRRAGLDPDRPPRTIDELDRYAIVFDKFDPRNPKRLERAGYLPLFPDWFLNYVVYWFGGDIFDVTTDRFTFTSPASVRAYEWVAGYSKRLGPQTSTEFTTGFAAFGSAQNPFLIGQVVMEQQGPWMANFIELLAPRMSEALVPKVIEPFLPRVLRPFNYDWGVAPFPSAVPGLEDVTYCGLDLLAIPRGAAHPREAFEFIKFVNRQDVMERLCAAHCKHSPLRQVSEGFIRMHPNPYIDVFERLASSANARGPQQVAILAEVTDEVNVLTQRVYSLTVPPEVALRDVQDRLTQKYEQYKQRQRARGQSK
jgi:ABC-type glycerol-3-phosphate transport system substrate-binding protein